MQYRITRLSCGRVETCETRKQFPAARRMLEAVTWDMLDANALRDRPIAYKLMATAGRITRDVHSATLELDAYASVTIERIGG